MFAQAIFHRVRLLAGLALALTLVAAPKAIAADWRSEPVFLKNVAHNKFLGIMTSVKFPYDWSLYSHIGAGQGHEETGDPIAWRFQPGVAPGTYEIVGRPTSEIAYYNDYGASRFCATEHGGYRLALARITKNAGRAECSWKVEDLGDGRMRLRNYWIDREVGAYVGRLECENESRCTFDYNERSDTDPMLLFEYSAAIPCETEKGWVTGTVISYQADRGMGTIRQHFCGAKVSVHTSNIEGGNLTVGQKVKFFRVVGRSGPAAERVSVTQ